MRANRWAAGWDLMHDADPDGEARARLGYNLVKANQQALDACAKATTNTKIDQHYTNRISIVARKFLCKCEGIMNLNGSYSHCPGGKYDPCKSVQLHSERTCVFYLALLMYRS